MQDIDGEVSTIIPYPSLDGWVTGLEHKLDLVLAGYFTSDYDQSTVFHGSIRSIMYTLADCGHDPHLCVERVKEDLSALISAYFKREVTVDVSYQNNEKDNGRYHLYMDVAVTDGRRDTVKVRNLIEVEGTKLNRFAKLNNTGEIVNEYIFQR